MKFLISVHKHFSVLANIAEWEESAKSNKIELDMMLNAL
jgi:hypothetical protein